MTYGILLDFPTSCVSPHGTGVITLMSLVCQDSLSDFLFICLFILRGVGWGLESAVRIPIQKTYCEKKKNPEDKEKKKEKRGKYQQGAVGGGTAISCVCGGGGGGGRYSKYLGEEGATGNMQRYVTAEEGFGHGRQTKPLEQ